jgi:hypothetical protein
MTNTLPAAVKGVVPILKVHELEASLEHFTATLGFTRAWAYGTFGCVERDGAEIFLSEAQGTRGTWLSVFVTDANALFAEIAPRGAKIVKPPTNMEHGMCECWVEDLDGNTLRFGHVLQARDLKIKRTTLEVRLEEKLAALLEELAAATARTVGEVLEETLLHTLEPATGREDVVWSPHSKAVFALIAELKQKHGLAYDAHGYQRFTEE